MIQNPSIEGCFEKKGFNAQILSRSVINRRKTNQIILARERSKFGKFCGGREGEKSEKVDRVKTKGRDENAVDDFEKFHKTGTISSTHYAKTQLH
jgi:hypothetical protein